MFITDIRSDAILVSCTGIDTVNLPWLVVSDERAWLATQWKGHRVCQEQEQRAEKNRKYPKYLN
jgi:hypothetical protein